MKRISHLLLLSIFLASCANAVTPTSNVTVTRFAELTVTFTPVPTSMPTEIPPTPSETPDPNRPPDATGQDKDGYYKEIDGVKYRQVLDSKSNVLVDGWFGDHIKNPTYKGGIPSMDEPGFSLKPAMPIYFRVKDGITAMYLVHVTNLDFKGGNTYSVNAMDTLMSRYYGKPLSHISTTELRNFFNNIFPNEFSVSLTDAQGNTHAIYGDTSFTIVLVDPADIPNPDLNIPNRPNQPNILAFTIFDDAAHSVTILVANTAPIDSLSDQQFINTILIPYGHVLVFPDLNPSLWRANPGMASNATSFATMAFKGTPYFTLSDSP
jgi:hypothetical protein